jgi:riboflavin transporter FmnP
MRAIVSILSATLVGSLLFQCYLAIWHPSSFGPFAEFPILLIYAACIATAAVLVLVVPGFVWLRRTQRSVSPAAGFLAGLILGCLVMLLFMALSHWPVRVGELVAGSAAGAVGVSIYARLTSKRIA